MLGPDGLDADGLKVDFTARTPTGRALTATGGSWGIALLHELLSIVYAAAKEAKPDALVITHTPHPSFVDVTDMIRLNDIIGGDVVEQMTRARGDRARRVPRAPDRHRRLARAEQARVARVPRAEAGDRRAVALLRHAHRLHRRRARGGRLRGAAQGVGGVEGSTPVSTEADSYRENGYVLVRSVFDQDEVEEMRDAIGRILETVAATAHDKSHTWAGVDQSLQLKGFHDLTYHDGVFTRMVAHPRLVEVLTQLIGPNVQLHHTKMLVKPPEQGAPFPMHQDYPYFPHERHSVLAASVHLDDTDEENGCLHVVPGSHRLGPLEASGESKTRGLPARERRRLPGRRRRRALLQLPHDPRLGREPQHAHAAGTCSSSTGIRPTRRSSGTGRRGARRLGRRRRSIAGSNPGFWPWRSRLAVVQRHSAEKVRLNPSVKVPARGVYRL